MNRLWILFVGFLGVNGTAQASFLQDIPTLQKEKRGNNSDLEISTENLKNIRTKLQELWSLLQEGFGANSKVIGNFQALKASIGEPRESKNETYGMPLGASSHTFIPGETMNEEKETYDIILEAASPISEEQKEAYDIAFGAASHALSNLETAYFLLLKDKNADVEQLVKTSKEVLGNLHGKYESMLPKRRALALLCTQFTAYIDTEYCRKVGIILSNPSELKKSILEFGDNLKKQLQEEE